MSTKKWIGALMLGASLMVCAAVSGAQEAPGPQARRPQIGPVQGAGYKTTYIQLGQQGAGMLYEPTTPSPKSRIALVFSHPGGNNFNAPIGRELAARGYRVMNVDYRNAEAPGIDYQLPTISAAIGYLRSLPGVQKVLISGHSGGGHEMALYENVAENGSAACKGPEKLYPCQAPGLDGLQKPDGVVLLDSPLGAFHEASSIDPAVDKDVNVRNAALDMFSAANGFVGEGKSATYSPAFAKKYYAAQAARTATLLKQAQDRMALLNAGKGVYANDEPMIIPGLGSDAGGARLYQSDLQFSAHTKAPHMLLKADGTRPVQIVHTVRPANSNAAKQTRQLETATQDTTLRAYLSHAAIRINPDYAMTADDIVGVDWKSAWDSAPGNAYGITAPFLILTMGCHYLLVPGELIYDRVASKDKTYATVEGATHGFGPCKPEYGDTMKRTFDFVDEWLSKDGRF
jgi:hypothetical protein